jgi:hypothetical protein
VLGPWAGGSLVGTKFDSGLRWHLDLPDIGDQTVVQEEVQPLLPGSVLPVAHDLWLCGQRDCRHKRVWSTRDDLRPRGQHHGANLADSVPNSTVLGFEDNETPHADFIEEC